jgi:hypothetical protein
MATDAEYRALLRKHADESWKLEQAKVHAAVSALRVYRNTVAGLAVDASNAPAVLRGVDTATAEFAISLQGELLPAIDEAAALAGDMVSSSLSLAEVPSGLVDSRFAQSVKSLQTENVTKLTDDARRIVRREVQLGAIGQDLEATTGNIARTLRDRLTFRSIEARARAIATTEISKAYNLTAINSIESAQATNPDILVQWIHARFGVLQPRPAHVRLHLTTREKGATFSVNGHKAKGPHDPSLPASEVVHCSCRTVPNVKQENGQPFDLAGWASWPGLQPA